MIRVRQLKVSILNDTKEELINKIIKKINIKKDEILDLKIVKKSIDARYKNNIYYIYEVELKLKDEDKIIKSKDVYVTNNTKYSCKVTGKEKIKERIVIVGSGPAGLFCAYMLSLYGYNPLIIERGDKVENRVKKVNEFWKTGKLDENCNVQFGEGGAGTFSDGKLNTLIKDKENRFKKVFEIFISNGANEDIMYINKPHIGTDLLRNIIINMRNKIISMGGEFKYNSCMTDIKIKDNKIKSIIINNKEEIKCDALVLAIGHSARDTFYMLNDKGINMNSKPFAIGVRIQHSQDMINKSQYGKFSKYLKPSDYKLTYTSKSNKGVYSFCMCPGGYVVNASSNNGYLAVNGMSNHKRDSQNANSAIVVQVTKDDFGPNLFDGLEFQKKLEDLSFSSCNGKIPTQLYKDFKNKKVSTKFKSIIPEFKGQYEFYDLNKILPKFICDNLIEAIDSFENKIKGFSNDDAILSAVETRTSSPIRILRDENYISNIDGIYPCGEGAGYSGGITSSAIDGIKVFESIIKKYSNK